MYPIVPHTFTAVMDQYDDDECMLPMCVHHDFAKYGCDRIDAVNRIWMNSDESAGTDSSEEMMSHHLCSQVRR
ncbi:hypothetical protein TNCV_3929071 [Trichonephila clavipes]|nr:hypothetical protein TNCV_3929071 [Trichonephila clavipes]